MLESILPVCSPGNIAILVHKFQPKKIQHCFVCRNESFSSFFRFLKLLRRKEKKIHTHHRLYKIIQTGQCIAQEPIISLITENPMAFEKEDVQWSKIKASAVVMFVSPKLIYEIFTKIFQCKRIGIDYGSKTDFRSHVAEVLWKIKAAT